LAGDSRASRSAIVQLSQPSCKYLLAAIYELALAVMRRDHPRATLSREQAGVTRWLLKNTFRF
jgi:hypothetical protein